MTGVKVKTEKESDYCKSSHYKSYLNGGEIYDENQKIAVCRNCRKPHITRSNFLQFCGCCEEWYSGKPDSLACNNCIKWF